MPSKLKRHMHAALARRPQSSQPRVSIPPAPPVPKSTGAFQTLRLEGDLNFQLGGVALEDLQMMGLTDASKIRWFLSAWQDKTCMASTEVVEGKFADLGLALRDGQPRATKVELGAYMFDPETELSKCFPVDGCAFLTDRLLKDGQTEVELKDPFSQNTATLFLRTQNQVHVTLGPSAFERLPEVNERLQAMGSGVADEAKSSACRVPADCQPFMTGMTALTSGGITELKTGGVLTHYGVLTHHIFNLDRQLPKPLLFHFLAHSVFQSGKTLAQINALPDVDFVSVGASAVVTGHTNSADGSPYCYDRTVEAAMTADWSDLQKGSLLKIAPTTTENISLPFSETSYLGRAKPGVVKSLLEIFQCKSIKDLEAVAHSNPWVATCVSLTQDDCETTAMAAVMVAASITRHEWDAASTAAELAQCASTKGLGAGCVELGCAFFRRLKGLFKSGKLDIGLGIGLAGSASAQQTEIAPNTNADPQGAEGGGHCFGILRFRKDPAGVGLSPGGAPEKSGLHVEILEGTTRMKKVEVTSHTPGFRVLLRGPSTEVEKGLFLDEMLNALAQSVSHLSQVSNKVVGSPTTDVGWRGKQALPGFVRETMVMRHMHCLHEDESVPFYRWVVYTGWPCGPGGVGCMPVNEEGDSKTAGCRPCNLGGLGLRALPAGLDAAALAEAQAIYEEAMPPLASKQTLYEYCLNHYEPIKSLANINKDLDYEEGVRYETVCCMESPQILELRQLYRLAHSTLVDKTNQINEAAPDSDGIFGSVGVFENCVTTQLHVPVVHGPPRLVTYCRSMRQAAKELGWPGAEAWATTHAHLI